MFGVLERLAAAIEEVSNLDTATLGDTELGDLLAELRRLENQLDHIATRLTGEWDFRKAWRADHARSGAGWLAWKTHMPRNLARRRVRLARELRHMPVVDAAWRAGELEASHAAAFGRARNDRTATDFARDEAMLVDQAREFRFDDFARLLGYWKRGADPDGAEADAAEQRAKRRCHVSRSFDDTVFGELVLDPIGGTILLETLREIEAELLETDWNEARARLGERATVDDLRRSWPQRRADALVEMAIRARVAPADGRRPAPLFSVLVGYETFAGPLCELANGIAVTPGSLAPWLTQADIERVVFDSPSRVIDVGTTRRFFTGATRRAVEVRDRNRCYHPTCDTDDDLQVDHIQPFTAGGPTTVDNGRLACGYHNRLRHTHPPPARE